MLEVAVPLGGFEPVATAEACISWCDQAGIPTSSLMLYGRRWPGSLRRALGSRATFLIDAPGGRRFHLAAIGNHGLSIFSAEGLACDEELALAEHLVGDRLLITARFFDPEYERWQNASDPLEYQVAGRSLAGLRLRSNELPPPLTQDIVDTSTNPGRRVLRDGYVEAIAHRMWLGGEFWRRVPGSDRTKVAGADWLVQRSRGEFLEILAQAEPFSSVHSADIQDRLRRLLFGPTPIQ